MYHARITTTNQITMQNIASAEILILISAGLVVGLVVLLVLEVFNSRRISKLTYPVYEYALKRAQDEADHILADARQEARQIVGKAETESIALIHAREAEVGRADEEYHKALEAFHSELTARISESAKKGEAERSSLTEELAAHMKKESAQLGERLEKTLSSLGEENKERMDTHLAQSFKHAEEGLAAYEQARRNLVDSQIVALIGQTARIALHKDLTVDAHADLVRKALEEAKAQGVF